MAAWTYSDWVTYEDGSAKLTRLRLHVKEVTDALNGITGYSTDGLSVSRDPGTSRSYLDTLLAELKSLEASFGNSGRAGFTRGLGIQ